MVKPLSADDVLPLIACLTTHERLRLVRLISKATGASDAENYRALPAMPQEFSADDEPLAWDAEGWEDVALLGVRSAGTHFGHPTSGVQS